jgi:carbon-monoxide dehydrogenase medium subunit
MKPAPFAYEAPDSLPAALDLLARHGDEAKILAGGQSLIPVLNFRLSQPARLIDLNRIDGIEPQFRTGGHQRLQRGHGDASEGNGQYRS